MLSSCRDTTNILWEEFFRDPSQFLDIRTTKKNQNSPDFRHKLSGNGLWIDGWRNPPWVHARLQETKLPFPTTEEPVSDILGMIKACGKEKDIFKARRIHADIMGKDWIVKDIYVATALLHAYGNCGAVREARQVFDRLPQRDVVCWTALIKGYVENGLGDEALRCFKQMEDDGVSPDAVTYACGFKACALVGSLEVGETLHTRVTEEGLLNNNVVLGTALVDMYAKCGAILKAQEVFDKLPERNVISWTAIIAGYVQNGLGDQALKCFRQMKVAAVSPNEVTYIFALKACGIVGSLEMGEEIHDRVRELGLLNKNVGLCTTIVDMYAKCGAFEKAWESFGHLPYRDVVSWTALIAGYTEHGLGDQALECFRQMEEDRVSPNEVTYIYCLKACTIVGSLAIGEEIHKRVVKERLLKNNTVLGNILIHMYAKCGALHKACEVFDQMLARDVVSWTAIMAGYARVGQVNMTLHMFERMSAECIKPNLVTFLVLLNACSHAALLEEGERFIHDMVLVYGLTPTVEHYTCMVDMLGRAGQFDKAKCFLLDEVPLLLAFLGACQKWKNISLGRWAFEKLVRLDERCAAAYICMANLYAAAGMQLEAEKIEASRVKHKAWKA